MPQVSDVREIVGGDDDEEQSTLVQLYRKPSWIGILRSCLINLALPFLNGVFLGMGEIFAHEVAFMLGWRGATLRPASRMGLGTGHMVGPGMSLEKKPSAADDHELENLTSLE